jgi:hypothetical protein
MIITREYDTGWASAMPVITAPTDWRCRGRIPDAESLARPRRLFTAGGRLTNISPIGMTTPPRNCGERHDLSLLSTPAPQCCYLAILFYHAALLLIFYHA